MYFVVLDLVVQSLSCKSYSSIINKPLHCICYLQAAVLDLKKIRISYLKSWFIPDLIAAFPVGYILLIAVMGQSSQYFPHYKLFLHPQVECLWLVWRGT